MTAPGQDKTVQILASLNTLIVKACSCQRKKSLRFLILNETVELVDYDRALLFDLRDAKPKLLGVSGQATVSKESEQLNDIQGLITDIAHPAKIQILDENSFGKGNETFSKFQSDGAVSSVVWVPIIFEGEFLLGLWLERWNKPVWEEEELQVLHYLAPGYAAAWKHFSKRFRFIPKISKAALIFTGLILFFALFLVPVPLRMVAPCEIVPKNPYLVTAPLNGIIEEMLVNPGQVVEKGNLLFVYDKRVPEQELNVARKQVDIAESQLTRVMTLGVRDPKALTETAVWQLELQKEKIKLELAEYQATQLEVKAAVNGVTSFENPDEWRGKPVQIGERIMLITDPNQTKVKIWLAEADNIKIDRNKPVKVFLNIDPATTHRAKLRYVAEYSEISEKGVPSFTAEAEWIEQPEDVKIGVKGTAILYGKRVTLIYWILRKPMDAFRRLVGF